MRLALCGTVLVAVAAATGMQAMASDTIAIASRGGVGGEVWRQHFNCGIAVESLVETFRINYPKADFDLEISDTYRNMKGYIEEKEPRAVRFALEAEPRL